MRVWRSCVCCFSLILALISLVMIGITYYIHSDFAQIMENRIKSEMIIKEDNTFYDDWINSKTNERINFYVFEVENPNAILNGSKPKLREVGPFVFRVERIKDRASFSFDKTLVTYVERKVYHFIEIMSSRSIDDSITVVNLQFMVLNPMLMQLAQTGSSSSDDSAVDSIFETFGSNVFVSKPIREILFGSESDPLINKISENFEAFSKRGLPVPQLLDPNFSLFPNNTENKFEVFTGYKTGLYGRVLKWNDRSSLNVWTGKSCNQINGSYDYQYYPLIDKNDRLYEYSTEMCRSIEMSFDGYYELEGIPLYRFTPVDNVFYSPKYNPKNRCYCLFPEKPEKCQFIGILDVSTCASGAPLILSNPHFRRASEVISKSIVGLSPEEQLHQSYIEIEPITGMVLHRKRRYQFNVHIRRCPLNPKLRKYLKESVIPLIWFEEVSERDETLKDKIRLVFVYPTQYEELIALSVTALGITLLVISLCCCCCCGKKKKIDPISDQEINSTKKMSEDNSEKGVDKTIISHNYDQIFKDKTPLSRLKPNPLKRPSTVLKRPGTTQSSASPIPKPPAMPAQPPLPPPPPALPQFIPIENPINSESDLRQNLLKEIRKGTSLKNVDKLQDIYLKKSESIDEVSNESQMIVSNGVSKGPIMTSLAKELEERMKRQNLDNYNSRNGPQSYYRWNNPANYSTLNQRTQFRNPPLPIQRTSIDSKAIKQSLETTYSVDSDFTDNELEEEDNEVSEHRLNVLNQLNSTENKFIINKSNSFNENPNNKSRQIITDIYRIVN